METLKKQTNIRGDVERNRQIFVETLKKTLEKQILVETLKKQTNIGGDVKETDKYSWRR